MQIESFKQLKALTMQVIDHMRSRSFFVTTSYDHEGRTRILATIMPITQDHIQGISSRKIKGKFIAIEFGTNNHHQLPEQLRYKKQIKKSGGVYLIVRDFVTFLLWFDLKFGG